MKTTKEKHIKAVTFDLWETLLFERNGADSLRNAYRCRNIATVLNSLGARSTSDQVSFALKSTIATLIKTWDTCKDVRHVELLRLIIQAMPWAAAKFKDNWLTNLSTAIVSPIFEIRPYLNPDTQKTLLELKKRGKSTALICNTGLTPGSALRKLLAELKTAQYFDMMVFSEEFGIRKPDRAIFNVTTERLKVKQYEVVHVGDNLISDVWGAKNAGLKAIHFSSEAGRDKIARADPQSLVSLSRNLGGSAIGQIVPDSILSTLAMLSDTIEDLERPGIRHI